MWVICVTTESEEIQMGLCALWMIIIRQMCQLDQHKTSAWVSKLEGWRQTDAQSRVEFLAIFITIWGHKTKGKAASNIA